MFNNAGIISNMDRTTLDTDNEKVKRVMIMVVFLGVLLFTANLATETIGEALYDYLMSKYAVLGLMKNLCVELGQYDIRVNSIAHIVSATPFFRNAMGIDKKTSSAEGSGCVAEIALYLSRDESKCVSGLNNVVDGGYSITNGSFTMQSKISFRKSKFVPKTYT
ncbi:hypothetical protein CUMW_005130, partial [Citrus unshiu]